MVSSQNRRAASLLMVSNTNTGLTTRIPMHLSMESHLPNVHHVYLSGLPSQQIKYTTLAFPQADLNDAVYIHMPQGWLYCPLTK